MRAALPALLAFLALGAAAQITSHTAYNVRSGASLPAACNPGPPITDLYYLTSGTTGLYECTATNTWTSVGTSILLQTNGTNNGSQSKLNLAAGTNVTITDNGSGTDTITASSTAATAFSALTSSTNTTAAMVVGTGASLAATGSGTIAATSVPAAGLGAGTIGNNTTGNAATASACATTDGCWPKNGAYGTPTSLTLTNATGLPVGGISATGTPSSTTYLEGDGKWATVSGGGVTLQTNGTNNSSQTALNLVASTGITLTNTSGGSVSIAASGGGSSSGTNLVQISNGTGGFISSTNLRADATQGFLGVRNDLTAPVNPLDVEWTGLSRSSPLNLETVVANYSSTSASPSDIHVVNVDSTLSGTDAAFADGTNSLVYEQLTDTRTPSAASTVTHQLATVSREFAQGGTNLTCTICAAYYGTASLQGSGETVQDLIGFLADAPGFSGTGTAQNYWAFRASLGSTVSGPTLGNVTGFSTTDPTVVTHNGGTGCVAGFAVGSGNCQTAGGSFAFFSDITAPSAFEAGLSVGKESVPTDMLDVNGALQVGNTGGGSAQIDIIATDQGVAKVHLIGPTGSLTRNDKYPSASSTLAGVVGDYNNAAVTGDLSSQTLFNLPDASGRLFALHVYGVCTSSVAGSTVTITVTYNDDNGAQTQSSSAQSCAAAGDVLTLNTSLWANAGGIGAVRISTTTANSPVYAIHAGLTLAGTNTINSN